MARDRVLQIRLSKEEYAHFEELADLENLPVATFARGRLLQNIETARMYVSETEIDLEIKHKDRKYAVRWVGNNVGQDYLFHALDKTVAEMKAAIEVKSEPL